MPGRTALVPIFAAALLASACGHGKPPAAAESGAPPADSSQFSVPRTRSPESSGLAAGAVIPVELLEVLDSSTPRGDADFVLGRIAGDVMGADGRLAFSAGARALMLVRRQESRNGVSTIDLALFSVIAGDRQVRFTEGFRDTAKAGFSENGTRPSVHLGDGMIVPFKLETSMSLKN